MSVQKKKRFLCDIGDNGVAFWDDLDGSAHATFSPKERRQLMLWLDEEDIKFKKKESKKITFTDFMGWLELDCREIITQCLLSCGDAVRQSFARDMHDLMTTYAIKCRSKFPSWPKPMRLSGLWISEK